MKKLFFLLVVVCTNGYASISSSMMSEIDSNIKTLESIVSLSNASLEIHTGEDSNFDPKKERFFVSRKGHIELDKLQGYLRSLAVRQHLLIPYTELIFPIDNQLAKLLDCSWTTHISPDFRLKKIIYRDGSARELEEKELITYHEIESRSEDSVQTMTPFERFLLDEVKTDSIAIQNSKPLQAVVVEVRLELPQYDVFSTDKVGEIDTPLGKIHVLAMQGNEIIYQLPFDMRDTVVQALYSDGRALDSKSSNSYTVYNEKQQQILHKAITLLQQLKSGKIQAKIESSQDIEHYLESNIPELFTLFDKPEQRVKVRYVGPVKQIEFLLPKTQEPTKTVTFEMTYEFHFDEGQADYLVATDFASGKNGILANNGHWLVAPTFDEYFRMLNRYYFTDQIDDRDNLYHFNPKISHLSKVDYQLTDSSLYQERYVKVAASINGAVGLVDATTGELVLPMEHPNNNLHHVGNQFWIGNTRNGKGVYNKDFKPLVPFRFSSISYVNGFFYATSESSIDSKIAVYNLKGQDITQGKYNDYYGHFSDGLLLVSQRKPKDDVYRSTYFFINRNGQVVIDFSQQKFIGVEPFSAGLALVQDKKTNLYGFIDTKGKMVIPCQYERAVPFFETSGLALVQSGNDDFTILIDKQGKVKKRLPSYPRFINHEGGKIYMRIGDALYDAFGNIISD